jgi:hypothetical protein
MVVRVGFGLVAAGVGGIAQDIDVTECSRNEMGVCDLGKRCEVILEMLNNESYCAGPFPDDRVVTILISLDRATQVSDLAESPL